MASWFEPLDLWQLLVNSLAGSVGIFFFLAFAFIAGLAAYFRMPNGVFIVMLVLFSVIMAPFVPSMWLLVLLLVIMVVGWQLVKIFR